jgi:plasmid stabilization system protein ParE
MSQAQVIWTNEALDDLLDLEEFLGIAKSEAIIDKILARAKQLETYPESGAVQEMPSHRQTYYCLKNIVLSHQNPITEACGTQAVADPCYRPVCHRPR